MEKITSINYEKVMGDLDKDREVALARMERRSVDLIDTLIGSSAVKEYSLDLLIFMWLELRKTDGSMDFTTQFLNYLAKKEGRNVISVEAPKKKRK